MLHLATESVVFCKAGKTHHRGRIARNYVWKYEDWHKDICWRRRFIGGRFFHVYRFQRHGDQLHLH